MCIVKNTFTYVLLDSYLYSAPYYLDWIGLDWTGLDYLKISDNRKSLEFCRHTLKPVVLMHHIMHSIMQIWFE